jgi:hypothetical protein
LSFDIFPGKFNRILKHFPEYLTPMNLAAIPEIRVETVGDEVAYWLPVRSLGKLRWIGLIPAGFSALWVWAVGHMLLDMIRPFSHDKPAGIQYVMAAVLAGFALMGCAPAGFVHVSHLFRKTGRAG